jgi:hypothetical protein
MTPETTLSVDAVVGQASELYEVRHGGTVPIGRLRNLATHYLAGSSPKQLGGLRAGLNRQKEITQGLCTDVDQTLDVVTVVVETIEEIVGKQSSLQN